MKLIKKEEVRDIKHIYDALQPNLIIDSYPLDTKYLLHFEDKDKNIITANVTKEEFEKLPLGYKVLDFKTLNNLQ